MTHIISNLPAGSGRPRPGAWVVAPRARRQAGLRLFCFPYSGGGASIFAPWARALPETIEVCAVQLPGRANRLAEPPFTAMAPLVQALVAAITPYLDQPFAFFGHSMGALLSFELAQALRRECGLQPACLVVSGHRAPQLPDPRPPVHDRPEHEFLGELRRLNGTPPEVLEHQELLQLLLPILRADFAVCETYRYQECPPLTCPIIALGGLADHDVPRPALEAWAAQTRAGCSVRMFPGDHFFLNTARHLVLYLLARELSHLAPISQREAM